LGLPPAKEEIKFLFESYSPDGVCGSELYNRSDLWVVEVTFRRLSGTRDVELQTADGAGDEWLLLSIGTIYGYKSI
jgi:hypothetical protein